MKKNNIKAAIKNLNRERRKRNIIFLTLVIWALLELYIPMVCAEMLIGTIIFHFLFTVPLMKSFITFSQNVKQLRKEIKAKSEK